MTKLNLKEMKSKLMEEANKYGLYIDLIDTDIDGMVSVYANSRQLVLFEEGHVNLIDEEGFVVKSYKKIGSAVKFLANMESVI